jgi:hypothetical protein
VLLVILRWLQPAFAEGPIHAQPAARWNDCTANATWLPARPARPQCRELQKAWCHGIAVSPPLCRGFAHASGIGFDFEQITYWCADRPVLPRLESYTRTRRQVRVANTNLNLLVLTATSGPARGEVSFVANSLAEPYGSAGNLHGGCHANCRMPDRALPQAQAWPDTVAWRALRRAHERT